MIGMKEVSQKDETSTMWSLGENYENIHVGFLYFQFLWGVLAKTKLHTIYMGLYGGMCSKWRLRQLHACRLQTCKEQRSGQLQLKSYSSTMRGIRKDWLMAEKYNTVTLDSPHVLGLISMADLHYISTNSN